MNLNTTFTYFILIQVRSSRLWFWTLGRQFVPLTCVQGGLMGVFSPPIDRFITGDWKWHFSQTFKCFMVAVLINYQQYFYNLHQQVTIMVGYFLSNNLFSILFHILSTICYSFNIKLHPHVDYYKLVSVTYHFILQTIQVIVYLDTSCIQNQCLIMEPQSRALSCLH
jgi:hypothetical protein